MSIEQEDGVFDPETMDVKRILRGPVVWVVLILLIGISVLRLGSLGQSFQRIDTSSALTLISEGKADKVKLVDGDQRIDITLKDGQKFTGDGVKDANRVQAFYIQPRGQQWGLRRCSHPFPGPLRVSQSRDW